MTGDENEYDDDEDDDTLAAVAADVGTYGFAGSQISTSVWRHLACANRTVRTRWAATGVPVTVVTAWWRRAVAKVTESCK